MTDEFIRAICLGILVTIFLVILLHGCSGCHEYQRIERREKWHGLAGPSRIYIYKEKKQATVSTEKPGKERP